MKSRQLPAFMAMAYALGVLSRADRLKVGSILFQEVTKDLVTPIGFGYNGTPPGKCNLCEVDNKTLPTVRHAERNVITKAARRGQSIEGTILFVTTCPCEDCASWIVDLGIKEVYFSNTYKSDEGLNILLDGGVSVKRVDKTEVADHLRLTLDYVENKDISE